MSFFRRLFGWDREPPESDPVIAESSRAICRDPGDFAAYAKRGDAFRNGGEFDGAIADYSAAIECYRGRLAYLRTGRIGEAAPLRDALRVSPETALACYNRGCTYLRKGENDRAVEDFTELIQANAQGDYYLERALAYLNKGAYDPALADLIEAIRLHPSDSRAYHRRGLVYLVKGEPDAAIADFSRVIENMSALGSTAPDLAPVYVDAYANRGTAFFTKKEYDRAIADYTAALDLEPRLALVYEGRARAYRAIGDIAEAIRDEQSAHELGSR